MTARSFDQPVPTPDFEGKALPLSAWNRDRCAGQAGLIAAVLICLFASPARAESDELLRDWIAAQTNLQTWAADFVQTRTLKSLAQPLSATGHVAFAAPNRFRWELGSPPKTIALRAAHELVVLYPRLRRAERYPLAGPGTGEWRDALALLEAGFPRSQAELEAQFNLLSQTVTNKTLNLVLQPKSAAARRMMPRITIVLETADFALRSTELQFADGSTMHNAFHKAVLNPPLDPGLFRPSIPDDYRTVEPLKK